MVSPFRLFSRDFRLLAGLQPEQPRCNAISELLADFEPDRCVITEMNSSSKNSAPKRGFRPDL